MHKSYHFHKSLLSQLLSVKVLDLSNRLNKPNDNKLWTKTGDHLDRKGRAEYTRYLLDKMINEIH